MTRALQSQFTLSFNWEEYVGPKGQTAVASFGYGGGTQAVMMIDVNWTDLDKAVEEILGKHFKSGTTLSRRLPMQHPQFPTLWCTRIQNVVGVAWGDKDETFWGASSSYQRARLTLLFEALPYPVLTDDELQTLYSGKEFYRFTSREIIPSSEVLQRQASTYKWAEGGGAGEPTVGDAVPFGVPMFLSKEEVTYTWWMVPEDGLFDSSNLPTKILNCVGKVNDAAFDNFTTGTLLLMPPRFEPVPAPFQVRTELWKPQRLWNVRLPMRHFDPPNGGSTHGHNILPYNGGNGKWFKVQSQTGSNTLYGTADFTDLFEMN